MAPPRQRPPLLGPVSCSDKVVLGRPPKASRSSAASDTLHTRVRGTELSVVAEGFSPLALRRPVSPAQPTTGQARIMRKTLLAGPLSPVVPGTKTTKIMVRLLRPRTYGPFSPHPTARVAQESPTTTRLTHTRLPTTKPPIAVSDTTPQLIANAPTGFAV